MTTVLLADDHPLMLAGIASLFAGTSFRIVSQEKDGDAALAAILELKPDIALIDQSMPGLSGVEILQILRQSDNATKVVILTAHLDDDCLVEAIDQSVEGIVLKDGGDRLLIECLEKVAAGSRWIPRELINRATKLREDSRNDPLTQLSSRERSIAGLVAQGLRNRAIAEELGLTEGTVKVYLNRLYEKLGISNRTELALTVNGARLTDDAPGDAV
ncbi:response regulator transcription factor [Altererythrobacter sp. TH136]|uniref:response regulator n=1 Tax=Altererythrobacter sp. TH136 TaxID=2067415 RepID=UPI00143D3D9B|nr:response regulator transcription factor [Altererythrobacter sp. TH136]